jgi:hypothetical protein
MAATPRILQSDGAPMYARTFSATTRHIPNPDRAGGGRRGYGYTLCGGAISLLSEYMNGSQPQLTDPRFILDLTPCERCEQSAAKRWGK